MEYDDEKITMLLGMGFPDVEAIKKALQASKGDMNDAVAFLTDRANELSYDIFSDSVHTTNQSLQDEDSTGFTSNAHSYLENKVLVDNFPVPCDRNEALSLCLSSAAHLIREGRVDADDSCLRFLQRTLPECFQRLMNCSSVRRWSPDIHDGIFELSKLHVDLVIDSLTNETIMESLLKTLALVFDTSTEWNQKNKLKPAPAHIPFDLCVAAYESYGWVVELFSQFLLRDGLKLILSKLGCPNNLSNSQISSLWWPVANTAHFLKDTQLLQDIIHAAKVSIHHIGHFDNTDLKSKDMTECFHAMESIHRICSAHNIVIKDVLSDIIKLRFSLIMRMLKIEHFSARMVALKELGKLVANSQKRAKNSLDYDTVQEWMREEKVLTLVLQGNLDQVQYTDRMKDLLEFVAPKMTEADLAYIWNICRKSSPQVIDNIHRILIAAATRFNPHQFEHLLLLIQKSWQKGDDRLREKLLTLIGMLGQDSRLGLTAEKMLETLWHLARVPTLSPHLVVQALDEHQRILKETANRAKLRKTYVVKCLEEMVEKETVYLPLRQLFNLCRHARPCFSYAKSEKITLSEWNNTYSIIKLVAESLAKSHALAVKANSGQPPLPQTLVDGKYTHGDYVNSHLEFLHFMLHEGDLYLSWPNCQQIWETLVLNSKASSEDKETCYEWFSQCIKDLEGETQEEFYKKCLLRLNPQSLTSSSFNCFTNYFYVININSARLIRTSNRTLADSLDIIGLDYVWEIILKCRDAGLAIEAIKLLHDMSYKSLTKRFSRTPVQLHQRFINQCYKKITETLSELKGEELQTTNRFSIDPTEVYGLPEDLKKTYMEQAGRILTVIEFYITSIEKSYDSKRFLIPHGASFLGKPIILHLREESSECHYSIQCHTNENIESVRQKAARSLNKKPEAVVGLTFEEYQPSVIELENESNGTVKFHNSGYNNNLLYQLGVLVSTNIVVKVSPFHGAPLREVTDTWTELPNLGTSSSDLDFEDKASENPSYGSDAHGYNSSLDTEKKLPGVVMADIGSEVFSMLYNLAMAADSETLEAVCKVLYLLPTDPDVSDLLENFCSESSTFLSKCTLQTSSNKIENGTKQLKSVLGVADGQISSFKVFYSLQVLSSKLMPLAVENEASSSSKFMEDFLTCGGLNILLDIIKPCSLPRNTDPRLRQNIYHLVLQMLSYLIGGLEDASAKPKPTPVSPVSAKKSAIDPSFSFKAGDVMPPTCTQIAYHLFSKIPTMEWIEILKNVQKIAWASAAGNIDLCSHDIPPRQGSRNNTICDSAYEKVFQSNMCMQATEIHSTDATVAVEALYLLVSLLQLRPQILEKWYCVPSVKEFIVDVLVGCCDEKVRKEAVDQLWKVARMRTPATPSPYYFLAQVLTKARLPLWVPTITLRGTTMKFIQQCSEYFELSSKMLNKLSISTQNLMEVNASQMLEDEVNWLMNCSTTRETTRSRPESNVSSIRSAENTIVAGHFTLILSLLTCEGVNAVKCGETIIPVILFEYLFPAAKLVSDYGRVEDCQEASQNCFPKCTGQESRIAAYKLLWKLATTSKSNYKTLSDGLIFLHHQLDMNNIKDFELDPIIDGSASNGFVGLKNGGATCYMNAVLQQIYMVPGLQERLLQLDTDEENEETFIYQLQSMFAYLKESYVQYYTPEKFWTCFTLANKPVNIKEQQDAFEFYSRVLELLESYLKSKGQEKLFSQRFEGKYSIQSICQDCPHRYEKEETFYGLSLTVTKCHDLVDSLDQFVKGEILEGANAYYCEKCSAKRTALFRTCIKVAPPVLVIQLKRFGYDWESNRSSKFDDYFKFPWTIDMSPYTAAGLAEHDDFMTPTKDKSLLDSTLNESSRTPRSRGFKPSPLKFTLSGSTFSSPRKCAPMRYELVGVVVHSGQANAGHYYSYIKDRGGNSITNPNKGKWFKFNDTSVQEVEMTDAFLEQECFGGTYKAKVSYDSSNPLPEDRLRYWNGYLLYYELQPEFCVTPRTPKTPRFSRSSKSLRASASSVQKFLTFESADMKKAPDRSSESDSGNAGPRKAGASLSELSELLEAGERKGMFPQKMPAKILAEIAHDNLLFLKNRDMFSEHYHEFMYEVCSSALEIRAKSDCVDADMCADATGLAIHYLLNTYLRTRHSDNATFDGWCSLIEKLLTSTEKASHWAVGYFSSKAGEAHIVPFLLECPRRNIRIKFGEILSKVLETDFEHTRSVSSVEEFVKYLLALLDSEVLSNIKQSVQYFKILYSYAKMGKPQSSQILRVGGLQKLLHFLLGSPMTGRRKWTASQTQDLASVHNAVATILLNCDFTRTISDAEESEIFFSCKLQRTSEHPLHQPVILYDLLYGEMRAKWLTEVGFAFREATIDRSLMTKVIIEASKGDSGFSCAALQVLMKYYFSSPSHTLKHLTELLIEVLSHDEFLLTKERLMCALCGSHDDISVPFRGLFQIIEESLYSDTRRSYQCIKLLVSLSARCETAREIITNHSSKWQRSVSWLRNQMNSGNKFAGTNLEMSSLSNEDSQNTRTFQRTTSAQWTLQEATALLGDIESVEMEIDEPDLDGIEESPEIENPFAEVFAPEDNSD